MPRSTRDELLQVGGRGFWDMPLEDRLGHQVCVHEAGHAAVATVVGARVERIEADLGFEGAGATVCRWRWQEPWAETMVYLAGREADRLFAGRYWSTGRADLEKARRLTPLRWARQAAAAEVRGALRDRWPAVERIALALFHAGGRLEGEELRNAMSTDLDAR